MSLLLGASSQVIAQTKNPYLKPDDSWITISGSVDAVRTDKFDLDYGDGVITVEFDDGDRDADAYKLVQGDKVRVSGRVDDDLFDLRTIEAASVFVENLDTTFFASAIDEEDRRTVITAPVVVSETIVSGTVTETSDDTFVVGTGVQEFTVDVDEMPVSPLDDEGYLKIEVGDRVTVTGDMSTTFFGNRQLEADSIVKTHQS